MSSPSIKTILETAHAGRKREALQQLSALLRGFPDCPYLLVFFSIFVLWQDSEDDGYTLDDVEAALLKAHEVDKSYLPALEELAHFYDVMKPDPAKARAFASSYIEKTRKILEDMQAIVAESGNLSEDEAEHE
jgi:hypothetical protein